MTPGTTTSSLPVLLQLSASTGPEECCLAVRKALDCLGREAAALGVQLDVVEQVDAQREGNLRSVLLALEGADADTLVQRWQGTLQWTCPSPYREGTARKNWFIGGTVFTPQGPGVPSLSVADIRFEAMRASGPGGQHVNKTDSAIRAIHLPSGLSVKVQTERSQHANKRLARALLACRLASLAEAAAGHERAARRLQHHRLVRGNADHVFSGETFRRTSPEPSIPPRGQFGARRCGASTEASP